MATRVKLDLDPAKLHSGSHDGLIVTACYESVADHLPKVKAMEIRDDDVLLCSFPKSGTHWLYRVLDMLQRGSTEYYERNLASTFLDCQRIELILELTSPRVLVTHLPFDRLPDQVKDKRTKIVHLYRDPRAVLVSFYFMLRDNDHGVTWGTAGATTDDIMRLFFSDSMPYHGWGGHLDHVIEYKQHNPQQPVCHVAYEDMALNPLDTVKKLAEFLEKPVTPDFCAQVVEACSFKKQKAAEESLSKASAEMKIYREGGAENWKNHLTVAQSEKMDQILSKRADTCPFTAKYIKTSPSSNLHQSKQ